MRKKRVYILRFVTWATALFSLLSCAEVVQVEDWVPSDVARTLELSNSSLVFEAEAQSRVIDVKSEGISWQFQNGASWVSLSPMAGDASARVTVTVDAQDEASNVARSSVALLRSTDASIPREYPLTITQNPTKPYIIISPEDQSIAFSGAASKREVVIETNRQLEVTSSDRSWLTVTRASEATNTYTIEVTANTTETSRDGYVNFSASGLDVQILVVQGVANVTSSISHLDFNYSASSKNVEIDAEADWKAYSGQAWIEVTPQSGKAGRAVLSVQVVENTGQQQRDGVVDVMVGGRDVLEITITQNGTQLSVNPHSLSFGSETSTQSLEIQSNIAWTLSCNKTWLSFDRESGTGSATVNVTAAQNTSGEEREADIKILDAQQQTMATISVVQTSNVLSASISRSTFEYNGDEAILTVYSTSDWTLTSSDWIWCSADHGTGRSQVTVRADANTSNENRNGEIVLAETSSNATYVVSIVQLGAPETGDIERSLGYTFPANGGAFGVNFYERENWTAEILEGSDWITISPTSGSGNTPIMVTTSDNPSGTQREGKISVNYSNKRFLCPIIQAGKSVKVSLSSVDFFAKGGTSTPITITADQDYSISCDASWLKVSRNGNVMTLTASRNNDNTMRTADVILTLPAIADMQPTVITVRQAGINGSFQFGEFDEDQKIN